MGDASNFTPFTLSKGNQWARFEPTSEPDTIFIRFCGACGTIMENSIDAETAMGEVARLYSLGYTDVENPE